MYQNTMHHCNAINALDVKEKEVRTIEGHCQEYVRRQFHFTCFQIRISNNNSYIKVLD